MKYLILFTAILSFCQITKASDRSDFSIQSNCIKDEYNLKEFTSYDLFFSPTPYKSANCIEDKDRKIELDKQAWDLLNKEYPDTYKQAVPFDLVSDKQEEFIVQGSSPSGGTNFYFLEKRNGKWKIILVITGGFTIRGNEITNWSRSGFDETWQTVYTYSKGSYKETSRQAVPLILLHQKGFIDLMMKLNGPNVRWN